MHKIYLVSPSTEVKFKSPCYSLEYIKYYIMDNGYDAEIIDCSNYDSGFEEVITKFKEDEKTYYWFNVLYARPFLVLMTL